LWPARSEKIDYRRRQARQYRLFAAARSNNQFPWQLHYQESITRFPVQQDSAVKIDRKALERELHGTVEL
jgi:hypothetical protein